MLKITKCRLPPAGYYDYIKQCMHYLKYKWTFITASQGGTEPSFHPVCKKYEPNTYPAFNFKISYSQLGFEIQLS